MITAKKRLKKKTDLKSTPRKLIEERWHYKKNKDSGPLKYIILDKHGNIIAGCPSIADARIISNAPWLLECLEHVVRANPQFYTGENICGADLVEWMGIHYGEWKELVEETRKNKLTVNKDTGNYYT